MKPCLDSTKIVEQLRQAAKDCTWMAKQHEKDTLYSLAADEIERLQGLLFQRGAMEDAPCFCCGDSGEDYFDLNRHPCAKHHIWP
jgi:hypothetical protein